MWSLNGRVARIAPRPGCPGALPPWPGLVSYAALALALALAVGCGGGGAAAGDDDNCDDCALGMSLCDGDAVRTCIQDGACTRFSDAIPCDDGLLCSGGACTDMCTDQCTVGAKRCAGNLVQECALQPSGCTDFSAPEACADGACTGDACPGECVDQCATVGATRCSSTVDGVETCSTQASGCLAWSPAVGCPGAQTCTSGACTTCQTGAERCSVNDNVETCTSGTWFETQSCAFGCTAGACQASVSCTPGAPRCNANAVEICNSSGTAYLHAQTCASACASGLCVGACTPGTKRCNAGAAETCNAAGTAWEGSQACSAGCDAASGTCALASLDVTSSTSLDGEIVVNGPVFVRSGATLTSPTGNLTIRATSITVELNASIAAAPTGENAQGAGGAYTYTTCGGAGGGYGTIGGYASYCGTTGRGPAFGSATDAIVEQGAKGGNSPSGALGGKGGGVLRLVAGTITIAGQVTANGNAGAASSGTSGGGGGGSGGGILIAANTLTVSGTVSAAGGSGGVNSSNASYSGAVGGNGRIKLLRGISATVTGPVIGTVTEGLLPPLRITSSTHPDPNLIYNDDFSVIGLAWDRAFPSTQGYYHRTTTTQHQPPTPATGAFIASELLALDRTAVVAGANYFHIVPVDATSAVGTIENKLRLQINTTPPTVSSSSHPSETAWSANPNAFFSWTLPTADANHKGYYYVLDHYGDTVPPTTGPLLPVTQKQILLSNLTPGIWQFHVVSIDQRGYRTRAADHYQIRIGADPGVGTLLGTISAGGSPLQGAKVRINRSLIGPDQTSLANGAYNFGGAVPAGTWEVSVEKAGYQTQTMTVTVAAGGSTTANFALVP